MYVRLLFAASAISLLLFIAGCGPKGGETADPGADDAAATEPGATEPSATEPGATDPGATDPEATEPEATEPSGPSDTDLDVKPEEVDAIPPPVPAP
jgi:hypothetical protein